MIIDLYKLRQRGETESRFEFVFDPDKDLMTIPNAEFAPNAKISFLAEVFENKAYLSGTLEFTVKGKCARCLEDAKADVLVDFDEEFRPAPCAEEDVNVYERDRIDVSAFASQLILTNLPYAIYCKEDCKGLCPTCGKNLNEAECGCNKN